MMPLLSLSKTNGSAWLHSSCNKQQCWAYFYFSLGPSFPSVFVRGAHSPKKKPPSFTQGTFSTLFLIMERLRASRHGRKEGEGGTSS
jgi:hypothetical protein